MKEGLISFYEWRERAWMKFQGESTRGGARGTGGSNEVRFRTHGLFKKREKKRVWEGGRVFSRVNAERDGLMDVLRWVWVRVLLKGWTRRDAKLMDELRIVKRDSAMSKGVSLRANAMRCRTHGSIRVSKRRVNRFFFSRDVEFMDELKWVWEESRVRASIQGEKT